MTKRSRLPLRLALAFGLALSLAGCESAGDIFSFLEPQKKPAPGTRVPVFPSGVPGVDYSTPLGQPSNANAPLDQLSQQKPQQQQQKQQ